MSPPLNKEHTMAEDPLCGSDYRPLLRNGTYEAQCFKYDSKFCFGKTRKLFLHFKIIQPGEYFGEAIFMAFNIPYDRKISQGSKYYKTWVHVNGWRKPSRNAKMSPKLFLNRICRVRTRTVKPTVNGQKMPKDFWYSVVDTIVEVVQ